MLYISEINLYNFRNHTSFSCVSNGDSMVVYGPNGSGKTSILESISLMSPGKGIRSAQLTEIGNANSDWMAKFKVINGDNTYDISISCGGGKRSIKLNDKPGIRSHDILKIMNVLWINPKIDILFLEESSELRKFFDRIVFSYNSEHARNIVNYDYMRSRRMKLLQTNASNSNLLNSLECVMADYGVKIAGARIDMITKLSELIEKSNYALPRPIIAIDGEVENFLQMNKVEDVLSWFQLNLHNGRAKDLLRKRTSFGVHTSKFSVINQHKNITARFCSTGEQKILLIYILLSAVQDNTILLFDDISSHIDSIYHDKVLDSILSSGCQSWLSDTEQHRYKHHSLDMVGLGVAEECKSMQNRNLYTT